MKAGRTFAAALAVGISACTGGQPEAPSPSEVQLGYSLPATNPVTYVATDTALVNIEVQPGMAMEQTMGQNSQVRLSFAPTMGTAGNLTVTATYVDFTAFMESAMMPRQEVGVDAFEGDFVLSVTPDGDVEQISGPELPEEVQGMTMGEDLFANFFLRLPARIVAPGDSWSDTIRVDEENEGAHTVSETIVNSTFRGDTTVAGQTLWIIDATKTAHVVIEGNMQGMEMRNEIQGTMNETSLWDPARRILVSTRSTGTMNGTVDIPSAGMAGIPLTVTNTRSVRLVEGQS